MGGLISTRDIAELTQLATSLAAQTMNSNSELLSRPGRPEARPVSVNARPSEMLGQTLTNMMQPATEQLAKALGSAPGAREGLAPAARARAVKTELPVAELPAEELAPRRPLGGGQMGGLLDMANQFLGRTQGFDGKPLVSEKNPMPTLKQLIPGAMRNFGIGRGEGECGGRGRTTPPPSGCLPFIGEFMGAIYGNCVKQADERTWDVWGKEITNALMGGKIDLLRAR